MGRKIPGRKHHGVRDPEKQAEVRLNRVKDKINAPPVNVDDQQIPKSLSRVTDLIEKCKSGYFNLKRKPKPISTKPKFVGKPEKAAPEFKQNKGESNKAFLYRINRVCEEVKKEAAFENKYNVDVKRNPKTGEVEGVTKRPKDELELLVKKARKEQKTDAKGKKKKKKKKSDEPKLTKSQKRQAKLKERKNNQELRNLDEFSSLKDTVQFGDVVHAPPTLTAPRKVEASKCAPRPGQKNLLLKSLFTNKTSDVASKETKPKKASSKLLGIKDKTIDKKGKRKDLPNAMRRQLEKQQKEIISAYKELKAKKYKT